MPCYRCGTRQVDPDRGSSPWLRGVRADRQVLICPGCQADGTWVTDLDRCALCASIHLVRRLGEVECRDCGAVGAEAAGSVAGVVAGGSVAGGLAGAAGAAGSGVGSAASGLGPSGLGASGLGASGLGGGAPGVEVTWSVGGEDARDSLAAGLAEEVEQALARVLHRPAAPPGQRASTSTALAAGRIGLGCSG